jgi:hypothetical protein
MRLRTFLSILVSCCAVAACATPPGDPAAAQPRVDPEMRTGSRLPGNNSGMTGTASRDDVMNDRSRSGSSASRQ